MQGTNDRNHFTLVEKLPRFTSNFSAPITEESDADDYYPFVIGHGPSFKVIDPKVYKQLRRHNIQQKPTSKVAECTRKPTIVSHKTPATTKTKLSSSDSADDGDEYCELSPLAKAPPIKLTTLRSYSTPGELNPKPSLGRVSSFDRRLYTDCYYSKTKASLVESQPSSPQSRPTTRLVDNSNSFNRTNQGSQWTNDKQKPLLCGVEADELIDYASCMCCVKGIFYHCTKDNFDEGHLAEEPCSCAGPVSSCAPRWGCLALLSLFIPCLWCYLPARGCKKAATSSRKKKKTQKSFKFNSK